MNIMTSKMKQTIEHRQLSLVRPVTDKGKKLDSDYYIEGYAVKYEPYEMFEIDGVKYYEKIDRNAFVGADMSDVIMQYDHMGRVLARTTNKTLLLDVDDNGLLVCADLSTTDASKNLYEDVSTGLVTKMSWAFTVADEEYDRENHTRVIKRIKKVYDVSAVSIPANDDTEINARSLYKTKFINHESRTKEIQRLKLKLQI